MRRDAKAERNLRKKGFKVYKVWECRLSNSEKVQRRFSRLTGEIDEE
jgi:G:T-mismatch repair DNA endonuclease (very short patch repair protein)